MRHRTDTLSLTVPVSADNVDQSLSATQIQDHINEITALLRGPLSNVERAMLVIDRRELQARLAQMDVAK